MNPAEEYRSVIIELNVGRLALCDHGGLWCLQYRISRTTQQKEHGALQSMLGSVNVYDEVCSYSQQGYF